MPVAATEFERARLERMLAQPVASATQAEWGFTNRTDMVTLGSGERVVVQRYRRRGDVEHRVRVMRALSKPAVDAGIAVPLVRESDLDADPAWVMFDALPGVPVPEAGERGLDGRHFPATARLMGEVLGSFRQLRIAGLELDYLCANPHRLATQVGDWHGQLAELSASELDALAEVIDRVPALFAQRPVVLAHGDFTPVNMLTDGTSVTGLLDFESVRLADPLFDVAWWAWAVSFTSPSVLEAAWPAFLEGAGIDADDPNLSARIHSIQVLPMVELLIAEPRLGPDIKRIVSNRFKAVLRSP